MLLRHRQKLTAQEDLAEQKHKKYQRNFNEAIEKQKN